MILTFNLSNLFAHPQTLSYTTVINMNRPVCELPEFENREKKRNMERTLRLKEINFN